METPEHSSVREGKLAQVLIPTVNDEKLCPLAKHENATPMRLLFSKVLAITYHHKTSVHASQMNWYLWRDVITFDKNSNKLFIPSAKQGLQNVVQISIHIFDPHTSGIFFNTRRVALNTGVNKSYLDRKSPALNYVTERVSQQCFDQQVFQGVTNLPNWKLRTAEPAEPNKNHLF